MRVALLIGRSLGVLTWAFYAKRRRIAYANLKSAFSKEYSLNKIRLLTRRSFENLGMNVIELLRFPRMGRSYLDRFVKIENAYRIDEALSRGKGGIFLTAHFGNWELGGLAAAARGYQVMVLVREQKPFAINRLLNSYRALTGGEVVAKGMAVRNIMRGLKDNKMVAMLGDQDAGKKGVFVDFFGRSASTPPGAIAFALKTGCTILPTFVIRENGPCHRLVFAPPLELTRTGDEERDIKDALTRFSRILERYIRAHPDQWLWMHKRWKSTPVRRILVLNDGKAGHLAQSLAVAQILKEAKDDKDVQIITVKPKLKIGASRTIQSFSSLFSSSWCQGCLGCLRFSLKSDSFKKIVREYADIIISAGRSMASINVLLSKENNAKSIVVMRPGIPIGRFDLAIIPRHDHPPKKKNVVETIGAPNSINPQRLEKMAKEFSSRFSTISARPKLGLLIGGDTRDFFISGETVGRVTKEVLEIADELGWGALITTSRRTSPEAEGAITREAEGNPVCELLVIANKKNFPNVIKGILSLSKIVVVSGESVSMLSEAASSGRHVLVFQAEKKTKRMTKHEEMVNTLIAAGIAEKVKPEEIGAAIRRLSKEESKPKALNDREKILTCLKEIL